jgi:hypothetical protein
MYLEILAWWGQAHQFRQLFFLQHQPLHWNNVKYIKLNGRYHKSVSQACRYSAYDWIRILKMARILIGIRNRVPRM